MSSLAKSSREPPSRVRRRRPARSLEDPAQSFERLRRALLGPEQVRIEDLERRPDVTAANVGSVLPDAVARATGVHEKELGIALEPAVTTAIEGVVTRRPEMFGEILAPTIGAAVRKAVADAFAAMLQRFDEVLEHSLSIRSVHWRIEAARTGVPFAEIVLLRTLKFRVEQVFLIHTKTSLVLSHVADPSLHTESPDQVAAMLSAIDAFGREALGPVPDDDHIDKLKLGDVTVWVCRGASVTVAAVVRGDARAETAALLAEARERIALAHEADIARFEGDVAPFVGARPVLETLLQKEVTKPPRRAHVWLVIVTAAIVVTLGVLGWRTHIVHTRDERLTLATATALGDEPGIVVSAIDWHHGRGSVVGLRDPLAREPADVLAARGLGPVRTEFSPFASLDPPIVERRAQRALAPPEGARLSFADGTLYAAGVAPRAWTHDARLVARTLVGVERYDDGAVVDAEDVELRAARAALEASALSFAARDATLTADQEPALARAAAAALRLVRAAHDADAGVCVDVLGHADPTGLAPMNAALSDERARVSLVRLVAFGVPREIVRARGEGTWDAPGALARSVTFVTHVRPAGAGCGGAP